MATNPRTKQEAIDAQTMAIKVRAAATPAWPGRWAAAGPAQRVLPVYPLVWARPRPAGAVSGADRGGPAWRLAGPPRPQALPARQPA